MMTESRGGGVRGIPLRQVERHRPAIPFPSASDSAAWPVVLVSAPFMDVYHPSIQLGLLKAIAIKHGFTARTLHANLDFAALVGVEYYRRLCEHRGRLIGEWLFSKAAFEKSDPDPNARFLDDFGADLDFLGDTRENTRAALLDIRARIPDYLDSMTDAILANGTRVVGFSSTHQQNTASFALARRLKQRNADIVTLFGGANFDAPMGAEWVRSIESIDLAVTGEGDEAFPRVLAALVEGSDLSAVPGVMRRVGDEVIVTPQVPPTGGLDDLPLPDYDEYFEHAAELGVQHPRGRRGVWLPYESARGCWWGARHHCTFCGLNAETMTFRSKSPERVLDEMARQSYKYRSFRLSAVDNIMDVGYLKNLFPVLIENDINYELFYEVKSNLTRADVRILAQGGLRRIQPGLESLNSNVLRLMRKGVSAGANINLLRWARYYGIDVVWNVLWGFLGETEQDYRQQAALFPLLTHLQPPLGAARIWMERFSPLFTERATFPLRSLVPEPSYRYVYPENVDLQTAAYFFEYELQDALPDSTYAGVRAAADAWSAAWETTKPTLTYRYTPGFVEIYDRRHNLSNRGTYTFQGASADIYAICSDRPIKATAIRNRLPVEVSIEDVQKVLAIYEAHGLMFIDEGRALSLALPAGAGR